ncbi:peptidoglycan recognition family protein [Clostridium sp. SHJSY1]|uniref:peptidoglycan recognition protein family protein n=1 Tax=Clostridium sp. SHJSY1 TaxID=2942483 RepID=UPI00287B800C|nr:peptidoglycan recognition family protein [Clostridium sp. SHJSY1]
MKVSFLIIVGSQRRIKFEKKMKRRRVKTYIVIGVILMLSIYTVRNVSAEKSPQENVEYLLTMGVGEYNIKDFQEKREEYEKSLDIKELDYKLDEDIEKDNNPTVLVYHHTAAEGLTPENINKDHKGKGWGGIGYHFYIRKNGTIYRGRPEEYIGAHAIGKNYDSIGICLEGDFEVEEPTEAQKSSLVKLSTDMIIKYNLKDAIGHRDVYETLCPGEKFPMEEIKERVRDEIFKEKKF